MPAFGNRNYKGGPVEIVDYQAGKSLVAAHPRPVILLCVCRDPATCHRADVARRLAGEGFQVRELDAAPKQQLRLL